MIHTYIQFGVCVTPTAQLVFISRPRTARQSTTNTKWKSDRFERWVHCREFQRQLVQTLSEPLESSIRGVSISNHRMNIHAKRILILARLAVTVLRKRAHHKLWSGHCAGGHELNCSRKGAGITRGPVANVSSAPDIRVAVWPPCCNSGRQAVCSHSSTTRLLNNTVHIHRRQEVTVNKNVWHRDSWVQGFGLVKFLLCSIGHPSVRFLQNGCMVFVPMKYKCAIQRTAIQRTNKFDTQH